MTTTELLKIADEAYGTGNCVSSVVSEDQYVRNTGESLSEFIAGAIVHYADAPTGEVDFEATLKRLQDAIDVLERVYAAVNDAEDEA